MAKETVNIIINTNGPAQTFVVKNNVQKIVDGFSNESLAKIAALADKTDIDSKLTKLLNNPLVKMQL